MKNALGGEFLRIVYHHRAKRKKTVLVKLL